MDNENPNVQKKKQRCHLENMRYIFFPEQHNASENS